MLRKLRARVGGGHSSSLLVQESGSALFLREGAFDAAGREKIAELVRQLAALAPDGARRALVDMEADRA